MSKRYWNKDRGPWILGLSLVALAFFLTVIFVGFSYVYESVYHDHATSERRSKANQAFQEECAGIATVEELRKCFEAKVESIGDHQTTQEDLHAQKKMAQWAFWMLFVTGAIGIGTIFVAGYGAYWVWRTFLATQEMAADTRRIGEAQARAYLKMNLIQARQPTHKTRSRDGPRPA